MAAVIVISSMLLGAGNPPEAVFSPDTFTFREAFPDFALAGSVAKAFGKKMDDETSEEELASLQGQFTIVYYDDKNNEPHFCSDLTGIGYLKGLSEFACTKNDVVSIPAEIKELKNLKILNLEKAYSLTTIPPEISELENLETLKMFMTGIEHLPKEIGKLKNLKTLDMSSSPVIELPDEISKLFKLIELDIHSTQIKFIPASICNLKNLQYLDMSNLGLTELPDNIGDLTDLKTLNLFNNNLKKLPQSMSKMKKLEWLHVYDNYNLDEDYKSFITLVSPSALVNIDHAKADAANMYTDIHNGEKVVFRSNKILKDSSFIEIGSKITDINSNFFQQNVLYSIDELLPENPLIVDTTIGTIPSRGISFIDENNVIRYFFLAAVWMVRFHLSNFVRQIKQQYLAGR